MFWAVSPVTSLGLKQSTNYFIEFININKIGSGLKSYHFNGVGIAAGVIIGKNATQYNFGWEAA